MQLAAEIQKSKRDKRMPIETRGSAVLTPFA
jgi:hypothetical protein